jgi:glutamine amidotransferase
MCRWLAYAGSPILLAELLYEVEHSLIDQSLHARLGAVTTNADGFGVGWYDEGDPGTPALYRSIGPAWSDTNLKELAYRVSSPLFVAHVRASTGSPIQQTNCHPFRHGRWLWLHNGLIRGFTEFKRDLAVMVDPALYAGIAGTTDSEMMFYLALSFGLADDPVGAVERMVGFVEAVAREHGVEEPIQMTVATTDGERMWVFRYSSEGQTRSLYFSTAVEVLRLMYPHNENLHRVSPDTRIVVSEPLTYLAGAWQPLPEASYGVIHAGGDRLGAFHPTPP